MIHYIKGEITLKTPTFVVVETAGIGYHINISLNTYTQIEKLEKVKLLTYFQVREDSQTLYGFADSAERDIFTHLISVSGIGTNTARVLLSSMSPTEVKSAIVNEQVEAFKKVKGVGPKTAKRIILDLKDKIEKEGEHLPLTVTNKSNTMRDEALHALVALGFNKITVQKTLNQIIKQNPDATNVEELIKLALKQFT